MVSGATHPDGQRLDGEVLAPGTRVGDYTVERLVGTGGCASVYLATHALIGRRVALKLIHFHLAATGMLQRLIREAQLVNKIRHPNIVDIFDVGFLEDKRPYLVMEFLEGSTLGDLRRARHRLSAAESLAYMKQICAALGAAHEAGVVHRDLCGSNIWVIEEKGVHKIKVLDFGIAKNLEPSGEPGLTTQYERLGSPNTMAPEQIRGGPIDRCADIYALGVMLFELLTGQYPFTGLPTDVEVAHLTQPPPRPSSLAAIAPAVEAVVLRCLEKDPANRYPSCAALLAALSDAVLGEDALAKTERRDVIAVHVEVSIVDGAPEDEGLLDEMASMIEAFEAAVMDAGFTLIQVGLAVCAATVLPESEVERRALEVRASRLAEEMRATAEQVRDRLKVKVQVRQGEGQVRLGPAGPQIAGGPIVTAFGQP